MIAIDAVPAAKQNKTGVEWYTYRLLKHMNELNPELDVVLYSHRPIDFELKGKWTNKVLKWPFPGWSKIRWSLELLLARPDVIFVPGDELPSVLNGKVVTTIHDLGFRHHPEYYSDDQRKRLERAHERAVAKADRIITITDVTKNDLVNEFKVDPSKCTTIHFGYDKAMFKVRDEGDSEVARVQSELKIDKPYLFYVGRIERKKGIDTLVKAFIEWKRESSLDVTEVELVLGGAPGEVGYDEVIELVDGHDDIHLIGHVDYKDLGPLRSGALAEVFPTRFEGFGMPTLEAMASGVPFMCSDMEVLREVGGEAPMYVKLDDVGEWVRALDEIMKPDTRARMRAQGLEHVKQYDWEKTARATLDILCNI